MLLPTIQHWGNLFPLLLLLKKGHMELYSFDLFLQPTCSSTTLACYWLVWVVWVQEALAPAMCLTTTCPVLRKGVGNSPAVWVPTVHILLIGSGDAFSMPTVNSKVCSLQSCYLRVWFILRILFGSVQYDWVLCSFWWGSARFYDPNYPGTQVFTKSTSLLLCLLLKILYQIWDSDSLSFHSLMDELSPESHSAAIAPK